MRETRLFPAEDARAQLKARPLGQTVHTDALFGVTKLWDIKNDQFKVDVKL